MAAESRMDYFLPPHCGEARGCVRNSEMVVRSYSPPTQMPPLSNPQLQYYARNDKRHMSDMQTQYHSWQTPPPPLHYPVPAYPSNELNGVAPMFGTMPQMRVQAPPPPPPSSYIPTTGHVVNPSQPTPRTRARLDFGTDSSSSNCTPRDHYGGIDRTLQKRPRARNGSPKFPVVKIPEALRKQGQPSPAPYLNSRGFPLRVGKPDCKHYTTKGWCAYGTLCKFNHPESIGMSHPVPCSTMTSYGHPPQGMGPPQWVGMHSYPPQWGPWTQQQQQQMYSMSQATCYAPCAGYSCTVSSPTASVHSSRENSSGSDIERAKDSEARAPLYN
eukprot:g2843.t1